jgi:hypothetical protein
MHGMSFPPSVQQTDCCIREVPCSTVGWHYWRCSSIPMQVFGLRLKQSGITKYVWCLTYHSPCTAGHRCHQKCHPEEHLDAGSSSVFVTRLLYTGASLITCLKAPSPTALCDKASGSPQLLKWRSHTLYCFCFVFFFQLLLPKPILSVAVQICSAIILLTFNIFDVQFTLQVHLCLDKFIFLKQHNLLLRNVLRSRLWSLF